ncbi:MAG: stage V sporulation protein AA [bacterium]
MITIKMVVIIIEIYIKPVKKLSVSEQNIIRINDICEVYTQPNLANKLKDIKILEIKEQVDKNYLISIIDIINIIDRSLPGHTINNLGESDIVIEYSVKNQEKNSVSKTIKIICVVIILLAGSSTAIMSFHSDAQMSKVFENYYYIFFNERVENPLLLDIPYSIGLAIGIIIFFNHFSGKKLTDDPTPIEVEMSLYEDNVIDTLIDSLSQEKSSVRKK